MTFLLTEKKISNFRSQNVKFSEIAWQMCFQVSYLKRRPLKLFVAITDGRKKVEGLFSKIPVSVLNTRLHKEKQGVYGF